MRPKTSDKLSVNIDHVKWAAYDIFQYRDEM